MPKPARSPFARLLLSSRAVKAEANRGEILALQLRLVFGGGAAQAQRVAAFGRRAAEPAPQRVHQGDERQK